MSYSDLTFKVAESYFRLCFPDEDDARRYLPSYAPFYIARPEADVQLMFTLTCAEGLVPFEGQGEMIGEFDCGGAMHGVYRAANSCSSRAQRENPPVHSMPPPVSTPAGPRLLEANLTEPLASTTP